MRKRLFPIVAALCLCAGIASGQDPKIRKAEEAMQLLQYAEAIKLYEEVLSKAEDQGVRIGLAVACQKNQEYGRAAAVFAQVKDWTQVAPEHLLQYGRVLLRAASCAEAQPVFDTYCERKPLDPRVALFRDVCSVLERLRADKGAFEVFPAGVNTTFHEMAPVFYNEQLVFASNRISLKGEFLDLFVAADPEGSAEAVPFAPELNTKLHEATATFTADLNRIFFTRSRENTKPLIDSRIVPLEILTSTRRADGTWAAPEPLNLTDPAYSSAHPSLGPDGKRLYFSSDRPGGFGGKDIYYSEQTASGWSTPVNLGPEINTEGDELFPFIGPDNRLYFSSDGHLGLGGQDIFYAVPRSSGEWGGVENMGVPFNSTEDDFALVLKTDGRSGYFSSNRSGGAGGDDVYGFRRLYYDLELSFEQASNALPVSGLTARSDCGALLEGKWLRLPPTSCCTVTAQAPGFETVVRKICASDAGVDFSKPYRIALDAEKVYSLQGSVTDQHSGAPLAGATIQVFEKPGKLITALVTDKEGNFSMRLPNNKCYTFKVEKGDYFARTMDDEVCAQGSQTLFVLDVLLQPFWISAAQTRNSLSGAAPAKGVFLTGVVTGSDNTAPFLLQIYYNQYSAQIREDAMPEMERLFRLLEDNPSVILEISSHTDSRGDKSFNQRLSQKRAENVVKWLIDRGIERNRLKAKGYGESRLVNHCADGVTCPEAEHQFNRRTEFRVVGTLKK